MTASWIILLLGSTVTAFLGWRAWHHHARSRAIGGILASTVKGLVDGPAKLEGEAIALGGLLEGPITGTPCLYFKLVVEERREYVESRSRPSGLGPTPGGRGRPQATSTRMQWVKVAEDAQQAECGLRDDTGVAEVELFDAELNLIGKESHRKGLINQCPSEVKRKVAERYGLATAGVVGALFGKKTRYTESLILPGDHLLVIGEAKVRPGRRPAIGQGERGRPAVTNRGEAEALGHHAWRRAGSGAGAAAVAALTAYLALHAPGDPQGPMMVANPAIGVAPVTAPAPVQATVPAVAAQSPDLGRPAVAPSPVPVSESRIDRDLRAARSTNPATRSFAIRRLRDDYQAPIAERQAEVAAFLMGRMNEAEGDFDAAQALAIWATPKELAEVPKFLGHRSLSKPAMAILGRFQVVFEAEAVASFLKTDRKESSSALVAMGPGAEPAVLPYLDESDDGVKREACYVLQRIGSAGSLPALDSMGEGPNKEVVQAARLAARAIRKRGNLPDPATAATLPGAVGPGNAPSDQWAGWAGDWTILGQKRFQHGSGVQSLAYGPSGRLLATADGGAIRVWDVGAAQPKEVGSLARPKATARDMIFLPGEKTLALGMDDNSLRLLDVSGSKLAERRRVDDQAGDVLSLALSPDRKTLAAGSDDMSIALYDVTGGSLERVGSLKLSDAGAGVKWLGFPPEGQALIAVTGSGDVRRWDLTVEPAREVARGKVKPGSALPAADLSPDGQYLAIADDDNRSVHLWAPTPKGFIRKHTWKDVAQKEIGALAWSPRGPILAAVDLSGRVILWNAETKAKVLDKQSPGEFRAAAFALPQGKPADRPRLRLAVASRAAKGEVTLLEPAPGTGKD